MEKKYLFLLVPTLNFGGQERVASRLTHMLEDKYRTILILYNDKDILYSYKGDMITLDFDTHNIKSLILKLFVNIRIIFKLKKLIKKYKPVASISFGRETTRLNCLAKCKGSKVISSVRGYSTVLEFKQKSLKGLITSWTFNHSDKIICVSKTIENDIGCLWPWKRKDLYTLYNGFDCENIRELSKEPLTEVYKEPYIVALGTMKYDKGYWHLIKAFKLVKKEFANYKLMIIGPDLNGTCEKLKKETEDLEISDSVIFTGLQSNPYKYMSNAQLFVLSSINEGFPNALVEAMACGLPVLATDCQSGPREILTEKYEKRVADKVEYVEYGILVPPLNPNINYSAEIIEACDITLANAIIEVLKDNEMRAHYSQMALKRAEIFSYEECKRRLISIVESE
jgi:glycosyltransferase involved in cell wall biosynthesis